MVAELRQRRNSGSAPRENGDDNVEMSGSPRKRGGGGGGGGKKLLIDAVSSCPSAPPLLTRDRCVRFPSLVAKFARCAHIQACTDVIPNTHASATLFPLRPTLINIFFFGFVLHGPPQRSLTDSLFPLSLPLPLSLSPPPNVQMHPKCCGCLD